VALPLRFSEQTATLLDNLLADPDAWRYGYELCRATGLKSGTLYPMLMRLVAAGWLEKRRELPPRAGAHPRQFYRLTAEGTRLARHYVRELHSRQRIYRELLGAGRAG
jgi:DNA-binding PadR family transcriptional regulator